MHAWRRARSATARNRRPPSPIRLVISTRPCRTGLAERPAGDRADMLLELRDRRSRRCVQCPELCTRGAISLTSTRWPVPVRAPRTSRPPARRHSRSASAIVSAMRARLAGDARAGSSAGTRETFRMWSRCSFSVTSKHSTLPSRRARRDDRDFALERHEGLRGSRAAPPSVAPGRGRIVAVADRSSGPCRHSRSAASSGSPAGRCASSAARELPPAIDDRRKRRGGDAELVDEVLLDQPVLRDRQHLAGRAAPACARPGRSRSAPARSRIRR